jgi:L-serine/L-threonine ammonia-lyase
VLHINTPCIESQSLSTTAGRKIWLKLEALQPPGSFKIRGIGHACEEYASRGATRFISSSGGNAGIAVAYAGRQLNIPVLVVVPETTTERAIGLIRQEGAEVRINGASWQEANDFAQSLKTDTDTLIHPFDDPLLWDGHATIIDELVQTDIEPDAIVVSVGGGGLLSGIVRGLHNHGLSDIPVIAVETEGAASLAEAIAADQPVELPAITSIATSLGARKVSQQAFDWTRRHQIWSEVIPDRSAVNGCVNFLYDHRILVEPACGAALSIAYEQSPVLEDYDSVLIIVCGGAVATVEQLLAWRNQFE